MNNTNTKQRFTQKSKVDKRKWNKTAVYMGVILILALLPIFIRSQYIVHILILLFVYLIATASLRTIIISGQFPVAHGAFMGIGAYFSAVPAKWLGWSPSLTIPLAGLISACIGMLIAYPFARLRALYYAMGSLFFGVAVIQFVYSLGKVTGGYNGLMGIPPLLPGVTSKTPYYYYFLALAIISLLALYRFEFCRIGTTLKAIDQSYMVASSVGINEAWYRILVLGVGCFFVGIAGASYAHYNLSLSPTSFNLLATLWLIMYVVTGGIGSFNGPIIGTFILILVGEFFRDLKIYSPYISAGLMAIVVYLMPQGLVSLPQIIQSRFSNWLKEKRASHAS
jgi:branched-chain amino acid transport system permease protein